MAKTSDNKSQFVCNDYVLKEIDISARKQVNSFNVKSAWCCVVTHDKKFLITAPAGYNCINRKWSMRTKKELHT